MYATYSEVYFAVSTETDVYFKIGETTNSSRRARQLEKEGYFITQTLDVPEDYAERLFVESYLRARISATGKASRFRTDYFQTDSANTVDWMAKHFNVWVREAITLLNQMQDDDIVKGVPVDTSAPEKRRESISPQLWVDFTFVPRDCKVQTHDAYLKIYPYQKKTFAL